MTHSKIKATIEKSRCGLRIASLAILAGCCSCSTPHPDALSRLDYSVPEHWAASSANRPEASSPWPFSFDDRQFSELVAEALAHNQDLKAASSRLAQAEANTIIARADLFPSVNAGFDASKRKQNFVGFPIPGSANQVLTTKSRIVGVSLSSQWELDLWGRVRAARQSAMAEYAANAAVLEATRLSVAAQTIKAALAVVESQKQLNFERATAALFRQTTERVRSRYDSGLRDSGDLRLTLNSVAEAESRVEQQKIQLIRAMRQLEILLGRYPAGNHAIHEFPKLPENIPPGLPSDLLKRRPDLIAAENRLIASLERVREAKASLFPRIALTASGGTSGEELQHLLDDTYSVWNLAANVVQPVFESGRLRAGVRRAKAASEESLATYQQDVLIAFAEVENALSDGVGLKSVEASLMEAAEQANAAWRLAEARYLGGLEGILPVLEAQRRAVTADRAVIQIQRQRLDNRVDLHLALGGSFEAATQVESPSLSLLNAIQVDR